MPAPDILLIHDANAMASGVADILSQVAPVRRLDMRASGALQTAGTNGAVVCVQHSRVKNFDWFSRLPGLTVDSVVFVIPSFSADYSNALEKLGVSSYLVAPAQPAALIAAVSTARDRVLEASWQDRPSLVRDALVASRSTFTSAFDDVRKSGHVDIARVADTCGLIAQSVTEESFSDWLAAIKDHHDYTYRHCMFVCGAIVHFGDTIGVKGDDLNLLSLGGMLHDIGKARVPLQILDKPGRLTPEEQGTMRYHPSHSRDIMATLEGLDPRAVAMAVHHHEKLDGSGYPDGLKDAQIDDLVRLTSIADVFSALIDERSYKPAMSYEAAFAKMESMAGHLDLEMLARFKEFAMATRPQAA